MKCVVTGAAGFIGSYLCEALLSAGHEVVGLDAFIPYYPKAIKEANVAGLRGRPGFSLVVADLRTDPLDAAVADADLVYHLAAMPGLPRSWTDFDLYESCNVTATQRLLEAIGRTAPRLQRLIYGSTSSVYGKFASGDETMPTRPISPYGVTKLAAEHLCRAHADSKGLPVVVLRFFSVYGPRQRPDMGYFKFMDALLRDQPVTVFGDGKQARGNTYIDDVIAAAVTAARATPGEVYNLGGGETADVWDILARIEMIAGKKFTVRNEAARPGDQRYTFADTAKLKTHVGWEPKVSLQDGLSRQYEWQRARQAGAG